MGKYKAQEQFIQDIFNLVGDEYSVEGEYVNSKTKVKIYCNTCKKYFWQIPNSHLNGNGCPFCVGRIWEGKK